MSPRSRIYLSSTRDARFERRKRPAVSPVSTVQGDDSDAKRTNGVYWRHLFDLAQGDDSVYSRSVAGRHVSNYSASVAYHIWVGIQLIAVVRWVRRQYELHQLSRARDPWHDGTLSVSYTHLTLPTNR